MSVGELQQLFGAHSVLPEADAERGSHFHFDRGLARLDLDRIGSEYPLSDAVTESLGLCCRAIDENEEFVAPPTTNQIELMANLAEFGGKLAEDLISGEVTIGIVDMLETVEIDEDERERLGTADACGQIQLKPSSVGKAGESVEVCLLFGLSQTAAIVR